MGSKASSRTKRLTANLRKLLVSQLRLHRHLFSSRHTATWGIFQPTHATGLNNLELISNCRTVTTTVCMTPGIDRSIFKNCSKRTTCGLNLLHTPEPILNCRTVPAIDCMTPGHDGSIFQNRSECLTCGLNLDVWLESA